MVTIRVQYTHDIQMPTTLVSFDRKGKLQALLRSGDSARLSAHFHRLPTDTAAHVPCPSLAWCSCGPATHTSPRRCRARRCSRA